jgi:2-octaprenyl-6-methoxyphenol hydroxylase
VRDACAIGADRHDYAQHLIVTTVTAAKSLDQCAYERFSDEGPVAMLPLGDRRAGLVLSVDAGSAADAAALDDDGFLALAQRRFGWRLGRLTRPGRRVAYPIHRVVARALIAPRTVLVGNAAQTIHPIGAQGFNLGLRDALTLAELVIEAARAGGDVGAASLLQTHAERRRADRDGTLAFSDGLVRVACSPALPLRPLRSLGMLLLDGVSPLKDALVRRGMGLRGRPTPYAFGERP